MAQAASCGPVDVLGCSLGAVTAAALAAAHPRLVRRLVLVAGFVTSSDPRIRLGFDLWARLPATTPDLYNRFCLLSAYSARHLGSLGVDRVAELLAAPIGPGTSRQIDLDTRIDIRHLLPRITAQTLVVGCSRDHLVPVENHRRLHEALPGSRYHESDSGHVVVEEQPAELTRLVRAFLLA